MQLNKILELQEYNVIIIDRTWKSVELSTTEDLKHFFERTEWNKEYTILHYDMLKDFKNSDYTVWGYWNPLYDEMENPSNSNCTVEGYFYFIEDIQKVNSLIVQRKEFSEVLEHYNNINRSNLKSLFDVTQEINDIVTKITDIEEEISDILVAYGILDCNIEF